MLLNLGTLEPQADGSLWVGFEASLVNTVSSRTARTTLTLSQKNKNQNHLAGQMAQQVKTTIAQDLDPHSGRTEHMLSSNHHSQASAHSTL